MGAPFYGGRHLEPTAFFDLTDRVFVLFVVIGYEFCFCLIWGWKKTCDNWFSHSLVRLLNVYSCFVMLDLLMSRSGLFLFCLFGKCFSLVLVKKFGCYFFFASV